MASLIDEFNSGSNAASNFYRNLIQNRYLDPMMAAKLENQKLVNKYYSPSMDAKIALTNAQAPYTQAQTRKINFGLDNPLLNQTGTAGQIGAALYLQDHNKNMPSSNGLIANPVENRANPDNSNENNEVTNNNEIPQNSNSGLIANPIQSTQSLNPSQMIMDSISSNAKNKNALSDYYQTRTKGYNYQSLPIDHKSAILAQAAGMGYDPQEATNLFMNGATINELAKKKGFDTSNLPEPIYPTTKSSLTQIQKRKQALAEMDSLGNTITEWTAPYARRFKNGISPQSLIDAYKNENTDKLAKYLAAQGLSLDQAAIRTRALGGPIGEKILNEMVSASMGRINFPTILLNTDLYKKTQQYMDKAIKDSVLKANKVGLTSKDDDNSQNSSQLATGRILVMSPDGKQGSISASSWEEAEKAGYKRM